MKIGIVCYPTYGGSGVLATELGKALALKGHQVHFITYAQPIRLDSFSENIFYHEVRFADYPLFELAPFETALTSKIIDVVKYEKLDLLHVHYAIPHASVAYMAKQILQQDNYRLPVVTTLHGTDITLVGKDPSYSPVVTFSIMQSDAVTAVSKHLQYETQKYFHIRKPIDVVYNFVDLNRFVPQSNEHLKRRFAPKGEYILTHMSNFRKVKRVQDVVKIFAQVQKVLSAKLLLIGDGPERINIELMCRECGICDHITFLGKQDAVEDILAISDIFLLPSESESFGLAALEAMACRVPCVSSNAGGLPEVNIDNITGFLAPVGDIDTMAQKAIYILSDEYRLMTFKENAYIQAQNFSIDLILPQYEKIYQRLFST